MEFWAFIIFLLVLLVGLQIFFYFIPVPLWLNAWAAGVPVELGYLIGMRFRKVSPQDIILPLIMASQAGLKLTPKELENHYLSGGHVVNVVSALIAADKARIPLDFQKAKAIDLAGRDVLEAVKMSVNPKVIQTQKIEAVAQDGIQVIATCLVTVRANIDKLVGGAGEETVLARVGEGVVTAIGKSENFREVLKNPDDLTQAVLDRGLDAGTAFEILSVDIADIDVGANIGARLQVDQANADKQIAQAKAEQRRAEAIARQHEMRAAVEESRAKVVQAEAEVPEALAEALEAGRFSVFDYYKMENVIADTRMREAIARSGDPDRLVHAG